MDKRSAIVGGAVALILAAWFVVPVVQVWLRTDEEHVRALLVDAEAGFESQDLADTLASFDTGYRETTVDIDRDTLESALRYLFLRAGEPWSVDLDHDLVVAVPPATEDGPWQLDFELTLHGRDPEPWHVRVQAVAERTGEDRRFRLTTSSHETLSGRPPRR